MSDPPRAVDLTDFATWLLTGSRPFHHIRMRSSEGVSFDAD